MGVNVNQLTRLPITQRHQHKFNSKVWKRKNSKEQFDGRHSEQWSNMMVDPALNEQIVAISDHIGTTHVDLCLDFRHAMLPSNQFKYPALVLRTSIEDNDHWLLWGLTYRMTGYVLTAMRIDHHLRYKQLSKGNYKWMDKIILLARDYFRLNIQWKSRGVEPYFSKTTRSKL